ncbi:MAG: PA14 domain-containing protein [Phycisphaerales bacterium]|jgi:hypothetical protein|nr:PA14 domain-containing protein [Phycisphaerales bacterium]
MKSSGPTRLQRRGTASVAALIAMAILGLVVSLAVMAGARDSDIAMRKLNAVRAQGAAQAAQERSIAEFVRNVDDDGDGRAGSISDNGNDADNPLLPGGARVMSRYLSFSQPVIGGVRYDRTQFRSTGTVGGTTRSWDTNMSSFQPANEQTIPGLLFEGYNTTTPTWTSPNAVGVTSTVAFHPVSNQAVWLGGPLSSWAVRMTGWINLNTAGTYGFLLDVEDAATLDINGVRVVDQPATGSGTGTFNVVTPGWYSIDVRWYKGGTGSRCFLRWQPPGAPMHTQVPGWALGYRPDRPLPPVQVHEGIVFTGVTTPTFRSTTEAWSSAFGPPDGGPKGNWFGSQADNVVQTNATNAGAISLWNSARINANVRVGPGGNPATVVAVDGTSQVVGTRTASTTLAAFPQSTNWPPGLASGPHTALNITTGTNLTNNAIHTSLTISNNATLWVIGDRDLFIDGDVLLDVGYIQFHTNASLQLHIRGNLTLRGNSHTAIQGSWNADQLVINFYGANRTITIDGITRLTGHIRGQGVTLINNGATDNVNTAYMIGTFRGRAIQMSNWSIIRADLGPFGGTSPGIAPATRGIWFLREVIP